MPDNNGVQYTNPPQSRNEELLEDIITDQPYTAPPQSEIEEILASIIDETPYSKAPTSRNADLLLQVKEKIEQGGGGDGTYTFEGLTSFEITPVNPNDVTDDYKGTAPDDKNLVNCPTLSEFYELFYDKYLEANLQEPLENYSVTKQSLGKDMSNTYDIWEYDFCPDNWERMILLSSGMNGFEIGGIFGLAYFLNNMVDNHEGDTLLDYLYRKVRIKVIPLINPWGYAQEPKVYANARGVNINRNFDYNGSWARFPTYSNDPFASNYHYGNVKGPEPFSEAETQIMIAWFEQNYGMEFWIDCHTGLVTFNKEIYTTSNTNDPYYSKVVSAHTKLEKWTKSYYHLNSLSTKYLYDQSSTLQIQWFNGVLQKPMLVIEQACGCQSLGMEYNGDRNTIVNYTAQIYAYLGEFLLKSSQTVNSNRYIKSSVQEKIAGTKFYEQKAITRTSKVLVSIEATKVTTSYAEGSTVATNDITVTAHYKDGSSAVVSGSGVKKYTNEIDASTAGVYPLNISYTEEFYCATTSIPITITSSGVVELASITATKTTVHYDIGDQLDLSDIVVTAHYTNGNTATVTNSATIDSSQVDMTTGGVYPIPISYTEDGITKTTSINIIVGGSTNYIVVKQGTIQADGTITTVETNRLYTEQSMPITHQDFHVEDVGGNGYWFGGRMYTEQDTFDTVVSQTAANSTVGYPNSAEHSTSWGITDDVTIRVGTNKLSSAKRIRLIIRLADNGDLTPATVDGRTITVDGVTYTLQAGT